MIYENVKTFADKKGMSIAELERKAELPNGTIGKWRNATPRADSLKRVADVLKVKVDKLMEGF